MTRGRRRYRIGTAPPSLNNASVNVRGRGRVKVKRSVKWAEAAGWELIEQGRCKIDGPFGFAMRVNPAATKADLDNLVKPVVDLLVQMFFVDDDRNLATLEAAWDRSVDCVEIEIWAADNWR